MKPLIVFTIFLIVVTLITFQDLTIPWKLAAIAIWPALSAVCYLIATRKKKKGSPWEEMVDGAQKSVQER